MKRPLFAALVVLVFAVMGVANADHGAVLEHIDNTTDLLASASSEFTAGNWTAGQNLLTQADAELQLARAEQPPGPNLLADFPPPAPAGSAVSGTSTQVKIAVFKPVVNGSTVTWVPLACDGTETISGIGEVRAVGYAKNTTTSAKTPRLRITYNIGEQWYEYAFPKLQPGIEVPVIDSIQDLDPSRTSYRFHWEVVGSGGYFVQCNFNAINIPASSTGFKSHRTTAGATVQGLTMSVKDYGTGTPIPCGSTFFTNRIKVSFEVDTAATPAGSYDFHTHIETGGPEAIGPDQDGNPADRRWWEAGFHDVPVPNNNTAVPPTLVASIATNVSGPRVTIHFAQQTGPGQPPNEIFCSFNRT